MKSTVVLFIYKRDANLINIINSLRAYNPCKIYLIADGPKNNNEKSMCNRVRSIAEHSINWNCKIIKIYSRNNLGLRKRVISGLDQVFKKELRAIFLEDDLAIDPSFFHFADELLERYKNNEKVISISGNNFQFGKLSLQESYYFSHYVHSWGWATWKRAWKLYDDKMADWPEKRTNGWLQTTFLNGIGRLYWRSIFDQVFSNKIDSWAYRWTYTAIKNNMYTIVPSQNLISNVGSGKEATHSKRRSKIINMPTSSMSFPLIHPSTISPNIQADRNTELNNYFQPLTFISSLLNKYL